MFKNATLVKLAFSVLAAKCDTKQVLGFVRRHVPQVELVEDIGKELLLVLPADSEHRQLYRQLFNSLDSNLEALHVKSYGISGTTLEEVQYNS